MASKEEKLVYQNFDMINEKALYQSKFHPINPRVQQQPYESGCPQLIHLLTTPQLLRYFLLSPRHEPKKSLFLCIKICNAWFRSFWFLPDSSSS
ncbi:hypothetical protein PRUPE_8G073900 [Prunus persica]|uniref:Uncharacterized protein n=1 Tax=Prunus persica TaxID=3760 RepID=A0A251MUL2_PRUPE|nr:hypothetical protein PRUPE_8G073900 [Prunus persica]